MSTALRIVHGNFGRVALLDMDCSLVRHAHPHCHVLLKVEGADTQFVVGNRIHPLTDSVAVLVDGWRPHSYADVHGRKGAMMIAIVGVSTAAFGALPTIAQAGIAASIMFLILRLVQGVFVGGVVASRHTHRN